MALAETTPQEASLLLHRAGEAGQKTPYFTPALERQRLLLLEAGVIGKAELRQWYLGESAEQAAEALRGIREEGK